MFPPLRNNKKLLLLVEDIVTAAPGVEVEDAVDVQAVELILSTHNLRIRRQLVNISFNEEDRGNEGDKKPRLPNRLRPRSLVDASLLAIATDIASSLPTASARCRFDDRVSATLFVVFAPL